VSEREVTTGRRLARILRKWLGRDTATPDFVARADSLRLQGELETAEAVCAEGLVSFPSYASAHVVMGDILRAQGLTGAAEAEWNEARRLHPDHPQANLRLAQLYLARGQVARAMAALELSLLSSPGSQEAHSLLAQAVRARPGDNNQEPRSAWLRPERFGEFLSAVSNCPSVRGASLVSGTGEVISGALGEAAAGLAATLMLESRHLMERIGAGPLRAALLRGQGRDLQCFEVDGYTLVVDLAPGTPVGMVRLEIQGTVAALRRRWDDVRTQDVIAAAA
jgi:tetratricopeptide (TPR) repeat protein